MNNKLQEWLDFLNVETEEELDTLENNTNNNAVKKQLLLFTGCQQTKENFTK